MTNSEKIRFVILRSIGNFLVLFAIYGVVATFGPAIFSEIKYRVAEARGVEYEVVDPTVSQKSFGDLTSSGQQNSQQTTDEGPTLGSVLAGSKEQVLVPKDVQFSIVIPKIGASARIFPNVDSGNPQEFQPVLEEGIAHAKGTVFPGMPGNVYLFAHSTDNWWNVGRYNAIFYLLKDVEIGDEVVVFFEGRRHDYIVTEKVIADPSDVSRLVNSQDGPEKLILQTCWPPGTTWKRLFVVATPKSEL